MMIIADFIETKFAPLICFICVSQSTMMYNINLRTELPIAMYNGPQSPCSSLHMIFGVIRRVKVLPQTSLSKNEEYGRVQQGLGLISLHQNGYLMKTSKKVIHSPIVIHVRQINFLVMYIKHPYLVQVIHWDVGILDLGTAKA